MKTEPEGVAAAPPSSSDDLSAMLSQITPENLHPEQDSGTAQGKEAW